MMVSGRCYTTSERLQDKGAATIVTRNSQGKGAAMAAALPTRKPQGKGAAMKRRYLASSRVYLAPYPQPFPACLEITGTKITGVYMREQLPASAPVTDYQDALLGSAFTISEKSAYRALFNSWGNVEYTGTSARDCAAKLALAAHNIAEGSWALGWGWNHGTWRCPELPSRIFLDEVLPTTKAAYLSQDGLALWINTAGMRALGFDGSCIQSAEMARTVHRGVLFGTLAQTALKRIFSTISIQKRTTLLEAHVQNLLLHGVGHVIDQGSSGLGGTRNYWALLAPSLRAKITVTMASKDNRAQFNSIAHCLPSQLAEVKPLTLASTANIAVIEDSISLHQAVVYEHLHVRALYRRGANLLKNVQRG